MSDETTPKVEEQTPEADTSVEEEVNSENQPAGGSRTFTQEEVDKIIKDRLDRATSKFSDYDDAKEKASKFDEIASAKTEAEKRAEEAEKKAAELSHKVELNEWLNQVSKESGVPASVIRGNTLEEMQEHASLIKSAMPVYPVVNDAGSHEPPSLTPEQILEIKDDKERKAAIAANLELFK